MVRVVALPDARYDPAQDPGSVICFVFTACRRVCAPYMADHWNSLANLLGTPSLAPPKAKGESTTPPPTEPSPPTAAPNPPTAAPGNFSQSAETQPEEKQRPTEKSRLKSSWDAVAGFFGIAQSETHSNPDTIEPTSPSPKASSSSPDIASPKRGETSSKSGPPRKGRPSMWSEPSVDEPAAKTTQRAPTQDDRPKREDGPPARHESRRTRESATTVEQVAQDSEGESVDRRSHRRPPRRARAEDARAQDESKDSSAEQQPTPRPRRESTQGERSPAPRTSRSTQERRTQGERSPASRTQDSRTPKRMSNFGEGIHGTREPDRDSISDASEIDTIDFGFEEEKSESKERYESSSASLSTDAKEGSTRRRRRGGRGRNRDQGEGKRSDRQSDARAEDLSCDQPDGDEEAAPSVRHSKIPTWNETISVLVEANMQNHQRSQGSQRGNPRGRGRR